MSRKKRAAKEEIAYFDEEGKFHPRSVSYPPHNAVTLPTISPLVIEFLQRFAGCQLECCSYSTLILKPATADDQRWRFHRATMKAIQFEIEKARNIKATFLRIGELRTTLYKEDWLTMLEFLEANMEKSKQWTQLLYILSFAQPDN